MKLSIRIEPELCYGVSFGTVEIIKLIRKRLNLGLAEAKTYVDRCVFDGETVFISIPTGVDTEKLLFDIRELETPVKIEAVIVKE